jgi:tRNA(Ile)-lysidine synthase
VKSKRAPTLPDRVLAYIRERQLMKPGDRVGVAVSGGADSVALLRLLLELRGGLGIVLSVIHVNHQLRGAESDADEVFVAALAQQHGLEFFARRVDVRVSAATKALSLEAAGRDLRYTVFHDIAQEQELDYVATAHTRDDQAETVLLKLLRGAWTRGLAGIYPTQPLTGSATVVRPLLSESREALRGYLRELQQQWREDASNQDRSFARNRVRHELLPLVEREFNPSAADVLSGLAEIARGEQQYWDERLPQLWSTVADVSSESRTEAGYQVSFCAERFRALSLAEQRRLVTYFLASAACLTLEFKHVETARMALVQGGNAVLPGGRELHSIDRQLSLKAAKRQG